MSKKRGAPMRRAAAKETAIKDVVWLKLNVTWGCDVDGEILYIDESGDYEIPTAIANLTDERERRNAIVAFLNRCDSHYLTPLGYAWGEDIDPNLIAWNREPKEE